MFSKKNNILMFLFIILIFILTFFMINYSMTKQEKTEENLVSEKELNLLISDAIKSRATGYMDGELITEGHIILDSEISEEKIKVYAIASLGIFGFENGIFTTVSGSGGIPTVMIFQKDDQGKYDLITYQEPLDGGGYSDSIKEMFPKNLQKEIFDDSQERLEELRAQQVAQAREYLDSISREAEIKPGHVKKELLDINVQASNKLFGEFTKYDEFLNNCPYWIGTREVVEEDDLVIFKKMNDQNEVVTEKKYVIKGTEPIEVK